MSRRLKDIGDWGESQACEFLKRQGFVVVERNYHTTTGEIDIVARQDGDYYFIEVKTRTDRALATDMAVTAHKKMKFERAVRAYCYRRNVPETGLILAGLIVFVDRASRTVKFRLAVWR
ncbi:MAG: YraN family protein [Candidatus Magasanikbacteria bacterium]|jgi:putative endonuclease